MSKVEIYYFSGTGNSLHVAKELQKLIPETDLIPIISLLNKDVIKTNAETIGFIFPLHAHTVPLPVEEFLKKINPESASYIFAVATRGGSPCIVFQDINRFLKKKGKILDANFIINMPNNYLLEGYDIATQEGIIELESEMQQRLDTIQKAIVDKEKGHNKNSHRKFFREYILLLIRKFYIIKTGYFNMEKNIYSDSKCTGCKICERVCLSGRITINDGRPVWQEDVKCSFCFACLHYCPVQSIQIRKSKTPEKGRYFHPEVTANDIASQKY